MFDDPIIQACAEFLREPGELFEFGIDECESEKYVQIAANKFPGKPYCLVRDWVLWDVRVTNREVEAFKAMGIQPIFLHAKFVIFDETGRAERGYYRMSTPLVTLGDPCFFVTKNTVYILTGEGTRKPADQDAVLAFYY